jgi:hypothetical protein
MGAAGAGAGAGAGALLTGYGLYYISEEMIKITGIERKDGDVEIRQLRSYMEAWSSM